MFNSIMRLDLLKEGRNIRLPILIIFYNSILAFVTILFIVFNNESMQVGYYTGKSAFLTQFLIISSIQLLSVFIMTPFSVSYMENSDHPVTEQFLMIPGVIRNYIGAKICILMLVNILIFLSSLPIISLSCIYSGTSLLQMFRLFGVLLLFSFWSASAAIFFHSINQRVIIAFAQTIFAYFIFSIGILLFLEMIRGSSLSMYQADEVTGGLRNLCLVVNLFNPLVVYAGYYGSLNGSAGIISAYFANFGIDVTSTRFSFFYYKGADVICILEGFVFLYLAVRFFYRGVRQ